MMKAPAPIWPAATVGDLAELDSVRASRVELRRLLTAPRDQAPDLINTVLRTSKALPQLVQHQPRGRHIHAVSSTEPPVTRLLVDGTGHERRRDLQ
ncbi:hypothetical protein GM708_02520 [Vibrio cholerae]|nr:hypothetical protein [Vibrio cholerae]